MSDPNPPRTARPNPYVGPRAFNFGEQIYGRDMETYRLVNLLSAERIVLFYSPSGAGKTSLIRAALIPELQERQFFVRKMIRVNREPTLKPANKSYNRYLFSMLSSLEADQPKDEQFSEQELAALSLAEYLQKRPLPAENNFEVFIFDQFEEILTLDPTDHPAKHEFFSKVGEMLANRSRWALFSMREDFVAGLDPFLRPIPTRFSARFRLDLLSTAAAEKAIQGPAASQNVTFKDEAAKILIEDLSLVQVQQPGGKVVKQLGQYVEPVQLQVVCVRLWENLSPAQNEIDTADLAQIGDVNTALAQYYAEQVAAAALDSGVHQRNIREWIETKLITKQGIRGQALLGSNLNEGLPDSVVTFLNRAHLVRIENRGGAFWLELAHDRLVQPVQNNNSAWFQANLSMLQRQAVLWKDGKEEKSLLLHGEALKEAETWKKLHPGELNEAEENYLKECQEAQKRELDDRALAEQAIKLEEQTRLGAKLRQRAVWLAGALVSVLVVLIIAVVLGLAAVANANEAKTQTNLALTAEQASRDQAQTAVAAQNIAQVQVKTISVAQAQAQSQASTATVALGEADIQRQTAEAASRLAQTEKAKAEYSSQLAATAAAEADSMRGVALLNSLVSNSLINVDYRPELALLLSVEAYRISNTLKAKSALLNALQHNTAQTLAPYSKSIPQQYSTIRMIAFQPNSNNVAWTTANGVSMWDIETQVLLWTENYQPETTSLAFSVDGSQLAVGAFSSEIYLLNSRDGSVAQIIRTNLPTILSLAFSPDGKYLAAAGGGSTIYLWDTSRYGAEPVALNHRESGGVRTLAWSPNSTYLAGAGSAQTIWIWNVPNQGITNKIATNARNVNSLDWAANGQWLAFGGNGETNRNAGIWDQISGEISPIPNIAREIRAVAFSPDNSVLAMGGYNLSVTLVETKTFRPIAPAIQTDSTVVTLAFRPGKPSLLAWGNGNANIGLYELNDQQPFYQYLPKMPGAVQSIRFTADQAVNVALNVNTFIRVYSVDLQNGDNELVYTPPYEATEISLLSPSGSLLVRGKEDGVVNTVDILSAGPAFSQSATIQKYRGTITSMALSQDNTLAAIGICTQVSPETETCLKNGIILRTLADGEAVAGPGHFADLLNGLEFPQEQSGSISSLAFDPSGRFLASGASDHSIAIWSLETGQLVVPPVTNHLFPVNSLAFNQAGAILASGDTSGSIVLWDIASLQPIGDPLLGLPFAVTSLAFSPDSTRLLSGYQSGDLSVWDIAIDSWIQRACAVAGRGLTTDEWKQYLPGERYNPTCK